MAAYLVGPNLKVAYCNKSSGEQKKIDEGTRRERLEHYNEESSQMKLDIKYKN